MQKREASHELLLVTNATQMPEVNNITFRKHGLGLEFF